MHQLKFILKLLFTAMVAFLLQIYLPWWSVAVAGLLIGFILSSSAGSSFVAGFLGVALYWGLLAFILDQGNEHILSGRMAALFGVPNGTFLILITATVGGLAGGFGALTGSYLRSWLLPTPA